MEWYYYILIVLIGIIVGFINVLAGGGSTISLAILIFLGLPPGTANGTNRIAILLSTLVGTSNFKYKKVFSIRENLWLIFPCITGAIIGAQLATDIQENLLEKFIGGFLVLVFLILLFKPNIWLKNTAQELKKKNKWLLGFFFFIIGIYGGFIQIGAGFIFLSLFTIVIGHDIIKANALKVFVILCYTPFALFVFIQNNQVDFLYGILLGLGTAIGALIGSNIALKKGSGFVRYFLLAVLFIFILKYFGLLNLEFLNLRFQFP